jgi:hypothetical protein
MATDISISSPVEVVRAFIACVSTKDMDSMRKLIHPKAAACLIRGNEPEFKPLSEAIDALGNAPQQFEETSWDEVEHIDGDYATVWASFKIQRDGEASDNFLVVARHVLLIHFAASSSRFSVILVLEKSSLRMAHSEYVRYCKAAKWYKSRMIRLMHGPCNSAQVMKAPRVA